ncbi:MAG: histidinol-phosphatase HisJ family protein [candidate division WOR-3 bacterium]
MLFDYHIHPDFSPDAQGSITDYCRQGLAIGVKELCFTTHYEPDPVRAEIERVVVKGQARAVDSDWVEDYFQEIERAQKEFPELKIRAGIEIGYEMGLEGRIADFLSQNRFDFVLGAVHCLDHISITSKGEIDEFRFQLKPRGSEFIAKRYFEYVRAAAGSGLFDCLAHLDIWRKCILPEMGAGFLDAIGQFIEPMVSAIAHSRTGLEINTSAFRRGDDEPYPQEEIVRLAVQRGVRTFTIGSDCHRVSDLGSGIKRGMEVLLKLGLEPARFQNRQMISE